MLLLFSAIVSSVAAAGEGDRSIFDYEEIKAEEIGSEEVEFAGHDLEDIDFEEVDFEEVDFDGGELEGSVGRENARKSRIVLSLGHTLSDSKRLSSSTRLLRMRGRLDYERTLQEQWYVGAKLQLTHYDESDEQGRIAQHSITQYQTDELWVQYSRERCMAQIGQQRLLWGVVEGAFVVDVATPFDFTEQLLTDFSAIRESQVMLVGNCYFGDFSSRQHIQLFVTPDAKRNRYQLESTATIQGSSIRHGRSEWGGRWHMRFEQLELTLIGASLLDDDLTIAHDRHRFLGAALIWGEGQWLWQAEVGRNRAASNEPDISVGLEYTTLSNHYFTCGITQAEIGHFAGVALARPEAERRYVINWQKSYLNDRLSVSGLWSRQYMGGIAGTDISSASLHAQYAWLDNVQLGAAITTTTVTADRISEITYRLDLFF